VINLPYTTRSATYWRADVDGRPPHVFRANGIAQAVEVAPGSSRVELRYWSRAALAGVLLSAITAIGLLSYAAGGLPRRSLVMVARVLAACGVAWLVYAWNHSLYAGEGWGTAYAWRSDPREGSRPISGVP